VTDTESQINITQKMIDELLQTGEFLEDSVFINSSLNITNYMSQMRLANSLGDRPGIPIPW